MNLSLEIVGVISGVVSALTALLSMWIKVKIEDRRLKRLSYDPSIHQNVLTALDFIKEKTGSDRTYVMEFHNGEHYFSGKSQQKISCTYESVNEGISSEANLLQNIRVSNYHALISSVSKNETFVCVDTSKLKGSNCFKQVLMAKGVQSVFARPISTLNGKIIGILILEFVKEERKWGDASEAFLRKQTKILSGYLI